ncbi:hypothetical protein E3E35_05190 [Thermococcus sp. GR7]|uniref:hypothetical protein n=1 Tax=unclassified Thermococcus TaxID=2627626 RepID=UPI001431730D|nr:MULTISPECIES: hypothetical protein [unclassified Thermococcus]NJD98348.1 hypothetical protein [Thermococcus sp. LS1]NJE46813.1 hypothetical protein [Thermococcus sp. GR7]NJE79624.1 hypothetical protein [Thermococcus sp. GR4]NJF23393.1 hypothetical protein [Thermococcus sp. GR5]
MGFRAIHFVFLFVTIFLMNYYSRTNTYLSWFFFTLTIAGTWLLMKAYEAKVGPVEDERTRLITMKSFYHGLLLGLVVLGYELIWLAGHDYETAVVFVKWLMLPLMVGILTAMILKVRYEMVM